MALARRGSCTWGILALICSRNIWRCSPSAGFFSSEMARIGRTWSRRKVNVSWKTSTSSRSIQKWLSRRSGCSRKASPAPRTKSQASARIFGFNAEFSRVLCLYRFLKVCGGGGSPGGSPFVVHRRTPGAKVEAFLVEDAADRSCWMRRLKSAE